MNKSLCSLRCNHALSKLSEGDIAGLTVLYDCMGRQIYTLALSILKSPIDAEDAMQETFLRVVQHIHTYRKDGNGRSWLLSITRNIAIDMIRKRKDTVCMESPEVMEKSCSSEDFADKVALEEALEQLNQTDREIIVLKVSVGMKFAEIAKLLDLPLTTVQKRYQRALKKLQFELQ